jgi:hypothetical protein
MTTFPRLDTQVASSFTVVYFSTALFLLMDWHTQLSLYVWSLGYPTYSLVLLLLDLHGVWLKVLGRGGPVTIRWY